MRKPTVEEITASLEHERREEERRAAEQLDPSDCALSSWASGVTTRLRHVELDLAKAGWMARFPVLLLHGEKVPAKVIDGKFGRVWALLDGERITGFVGISKGKKGGLVKNAVEAGYSEGSELAPAHAKTAAPKGARGFCSTVWIEIVRDSDGMAGGWIDEESAAEEAA